MITTDVYYAADFRLGIFRSGVQMVESAGRRGGDAQNQSSAKAELLYGVIDNSDFYS